LKRVWNWCKKNLKNDKKTSENAIEKIREESVRNLAESELKFENSLELTQNDLKKLKKMSKDTARLAEEETSRLVSELKETTEQLEVLMAETKAAEAKKAAEILKVKRAMELKQRAILKERLEREFRISKANRIRDEFLAVIIEARMQPKPIEMERELAERYQSIEDVSQRAHKILIDLKMVETYDY